jgi:hypothetical protein
MSKLQRINYGFNPEEEKVILSIINEAHRNGYATTPLLVLRHLVRLGIESHQQKQSSRKHANAK